MIRIGIYNFVHCKNQKACKQRLAAVRLRHAEAPVSRPWSTARLNCYIRALNPDKELTMTLLKPLLLICSLGLSGAVLADDASVTISSPADGAKVSASAPTQVTYSVVPGPKGDHVHLYVDGGEASVLRQLKGSHTVDTLTAGPHTICIKVVDKSHTPIGVEKCIKVTAG